MTGNARNDSLGVVSESVALRLEPADLTEVRVMRFDELWVIPGRPLHAGNARPRYFPNCRKIEDGCSRWLRDGDMRQRGRDTAIGCSGMSFSPDLEACLAAFKGSVRGFICGERPLTLARPYLPAELQSSTRGEGATIFTAICNKVTTRAPERSYTCFPAIISCNVATSRANAPRPAAVAVTVSAASPPRTPSEPTHSPPFASVSICAPRLPSVAPVSFFSRAIPDG